MQRPEMKGLAPLLDELRGSVEELLLVGLTAASAATVERLDVAFKEASRRRLLRLGSTLRLANEEISRFTTGATEFSARRLAFFLGRAWLLATGMRDALDRADEAALDRLMARAPSEPVERLATVTLGVGKRIVAGSFAAFDFRLRAVEGSGPIAAGESILWSCVFPMRRDLAVPAEAFLHLPQKQGFRPSLLLEKKVVVWSRCAVARQPGSPLRLVPGESTQVEPGAEFCDWRSLWHWDAPAAAARLEGLSPTPVDLEVELQEEVFLDDWQPGQLRACDEGFDVLPVQAGRLPFDLRLERGPAGEPLHAAVVELAARERRPPLFGVAHYERCSLVLQPLTAMGDDAPDYLTVSSERISRAEIVKAMKFT